MEISLYEECVKRGIPCHNHYSDLYIPLTHETGQLLAHYRLKGQVFVNQVEGGLWYDVAFQFNPYWDTVSSTEQKHV